MVAFHWKTLLSALPCDNNHIVVLFSVLKTVAAHFHSAQWCSTAGSLICRHYSLPVPAATGSIPESHLEWKLVLICSVEEEFSGLLVVYQLLEWWEVQLRHVSEAQQQHTHHISGDEADAQHWWEQHLPRQGNVPHWLPQCLTLSLQVNMWPKQPLPQSSGVLARPRRAAALKCNIMTLCLVSSCTTEQFSCSFTCFPTAQTHQTLVKDTVREAAQKILTNSAHIAFGNHGDRNVSIVIKQVQRREGGERSIIDSVT